MKKIEEFLAKYGITITDTSEEWQEMISDLKRDIEQERVTPEEAIKIEENIISTFKDFHDIIIEDLTAKKGTPNELVEDSEFDDNEFMERIEKAIRRKEAKLTIEVID